MKLLRYLHKETSIVGLGIRTDEGILPLSAMMENAPTNLKQLITSPVWANLQRMTEEAKPQRINIDEVECLPPVEHPGKVICVGLNYRDHVLEGGREIPDYPTIFLKASSSVIGHQQAITLPEVSQMIDFEAELAVVIGKEARNCLAEKAYDAVAGYTILNDVSARDYQRRTSQWTMGKSCDTFGPLGPVMVTKDEIPDPHSLTITSALNGNEMQRSNTKHLSFTIPFLIEYISSVMTLDPGDIISTGTPGGVGFFREPPVFLKRGDVVEITIDKIGTLYNPVQ